MLNFLRKLFPDTHPLRLLFHRLKAVIAALIYWFPADKMIVVGVTGTNGKTTTVNLLTEILDAAGEKVGMMSTINFQVGDQRWTNETQKTTASPFLIQKMLKRMAREGCKYVVMEVSSHALVQSRVWGVNIDVAVITNMTGDHLEYHGGYDEYRAAKAMLFEKVAKSPRKFGVSKVMVLNADDAEYNFFNQFVADRKLSYGMGSATVYAAQVNNTPQGSQYVLHVPNNKVDLKLQIPGEYNVYNSLAAATAALALGVEVANIKKGLERVRNVAGRFESVDCGQDFSVIVDYAHTPDALESLFSLYRKLTPGRLFAVFGATGGGRDKEKRPAMGKAVVQYADFIIVTNDDPYKEDEWQIIENVAEGVEREEGNNFWKIPDRFEAIRMALSLANEGDSVVIAGKGAQEKIFLKDGAHPWNDRKVVEQILSSKVEVELSEDELVKIKE